MHVFFPTRGPQKNALPPHVGAGRKAPLKN